MREILLTYLISLGALAANNDHLDGICKFKTQYFAEFDLTWLTKPITSELYTTNEVNSERDYMFNFCEFVPGRAEEKVYARMTNPDKPNEAEVVFGGEPLKIDPYLDAYYTKISGARTKGMVRGVRVTYGSNAPCSYDITKNYKLTFAVECDEDLT